VLSGTQAQVPWEMRDALLAIYLECHVSFPSLHESNCFGTSTKAERCAVTICALHSDKRKVVIALVVRMLSLMPFHMSPQEKADMTNEVANFEKRMNGQKEPCGATHGNIERRRLHIMTGISLRVDENRVKRQEDWCWCQTAIRRNERVPSLVMI